MPAKIIFHPERALNYRFNTSFFDAISDSEPPATPEATIIRYAFRTILTDHPQLDAFTISAIASDAAAWANARGYKDGFAIGSRQKHAPT